MEQLYLIQIWYTALVVLFLFEIATQGLTTIWFAIGAVFALILAYFNVNVVVQVIVFLTVSLVLLAKTRTVLVDKLQLGKEKTNIEAIIGQHCTVEETIEPLVAGRVILNGMSWLAMSNNESKIEQGTEVKVLRIEGAKLIVESI